MNDAEIKYYSDLKAKAIAELNLAKNARNLERVQILSALIAVYDEKIKESSK